jgi:hypothetical protein
VTGLVGVPGEDASIFRKWLVGADRFDLVRANSTATESGLVITNWPSSTPLESLNAFISKKISSTVVLDDIDD